MVTTPYNFGFLSQLLSINFPSKNFLLLQWRATTLGKALNDAGTLYAGGPSIVLTTNFSTLNAFASPGVLKFELPTTQSYPPNPVTRTALNKIFLFGPGASLGDTFGNVASFVNLSYFKPSAGGQQSTLNLKFTVSPNPRAPTSPFNTTGYFSLLNRPSAHNGKIFIYYNQIGYTGQGALTNAQLPQVVDTSTFCNDTSLIGFENFITRVSLSTSPNLPMVFGPSLSAIQSQCNFLNSFTGGGGWVPISLTISSNGQLTGGARWSQTVQTYKLASGKQANTLLLPTVANGIAAPQKVGPKQLVAHAGLNNASQVVFNVTYNFQLKTLTIK
jgi:hypothetical protein